MTLKFIDLFAGLGGFHLALRQLGYTCVFASELDPTLQSLYLTNFKMKPEGDITKIRVEAIPEHDILCAGFPCQPFSKAGLQQGLNDPRGTLFEESVLKIIEHHTPKYLLLENVPHLERHNQGQTWKTFSSRLQNLGYDVERNRLSPHEFGIPQIRDRLFIVGSRSGFGFDGFRWPDKHAAHAQMTIRDILEQDPQDARPLSPSVIHCLEVWQDFLEQYPKEEELPSFPIWSMEFGATYPYEDKTPHATALEELQNCSGSHGRSLSGLSQKELFEALPSHARTQEDRFPEWKIQFIRQNRELYARNRQWLDKWIPQILEFPSSFQKLEWNCKGGERNIWSYILQLRPSGVRVKRATTAPSLVAMTSTQVPIIASQRRYLTPKECARLQSMEKIILPSAPTRAFEALGNAVNVILVTMIAESLLSSAETSFQKEGLESSMTAAS